MRGERDTAGFPVVLDDVFGDEIGVVGTGLIGDQDAAGVVVGDIAGDDGVIGAHEVNALAAVHRFIGLEGRDARAGGAGKAEVVFGYVIVGDGDPGGAGGEDALVVGAGDGEAGDGDVAHAWYRRGCGAVDEDAIRLSVGIDGGGSVTGSLQRQGFGDDHALLVVAARDVDGVPRGSGGDSSADGLLT